MKRKYLIGYSLVEMSLVLVVIGIIGFFSIKFLSQIGSQTLNQQFKNDLERVNEALIGFVLANNRLPCPATTSGGSEVCTSANRQGFLPVTTLGIESNGQSNRGISIRYGVFRKTNATAVSDTDLALLKDRYEPLLPNAETSNQLSGLDFCLALKKASLGISDNTQVNIGSPGVNMAYALADSGMIDANNDGNLFDGVNGAGVKFEKPHKPHKNNYDDNVVAVSFNELSGKLNCPKVLSQTNGAARASFAAYDMWLLATQYKEFRDFNVAYLKSMLKVAESSRDLALAGVALALLSTAIAAADVAMDFTGASAIGITLALLATADAAYALVQALQGVADAQQAVADAVVQQNQAIASLARALAFKDSKLVIVKNLDQRGLIR
jgi:type II secretory pathway pseudopilin PulG